MDLPLKRPAGVGMSWLNGLCGGADSYSLGMLQKLLGTKVKTLPPGWQCHHISPAALCINHAAGTQDDTQTHRQLVHVHHYSATLSEEVLLIPSQPVHLSRWMGILSLHEIIHLWNLQTQLNVLFCSEVIHSVPIENHGAKLSVFLI